MNPLLHISDTSEIQGIIRDSDAPQCLPVAGNTKSGLSASSASVEASELAHTDDDRQVVINRLSLAGLRGITAYEPSEFLITARAGTPIQEMETALAEYGQYLPFDPLFVAQGATLGGTVASGISGPNCMLYGGLRDFVMEVELIDGLGELCRGGGKVVKNAAGFDLPKLVCGSYGRLGVLTEVTVKVLPQPRQSCSLWTTCKDLPTCIRAVQTLRSQPLPISSLGILPDARLLLRVAGPAASLEKVLARVREIVPTDWTTDGEGEAQPELEGQQLSSQLPWLSRVTLNVEQVPSLAAALARIKGVGVGAFACGGTVGWVGAQSPEQMDELDVSLQDLGCAGVVVRGPTSALRMLGTRSWIGAARRIQNAIDPKQRFVPFDHATLMAG